jgi:thioredoxin 1
VATFALTAANFEQTVSTHSMVLVDFWAPWCGPCRAFGPIFEEASREHPGVVFGTVNTDAEQELAAAANIASVPTVMAFREGTCVYSQPGSMPKSGLSELIDAVGALDMDEVRAHVAAARATPLSRASGQPQEGTTAGDHGGAPGAAGS